jgi:hypothetical protein
MELKKERKKRDKCKTVKVRPSIIDMTAFFIVSFPLRGFFWRFRLFEISTRVNHFCIVWINVVSGQALSNRGEYVGKRMRK